MTDHNPNDLPPDDLPPREPSDDSGQGDSPPPSDSGPAGAGASGDGTHLSGQVRTQHVTARVPEGVGQGVFSTGIILVTGASEFVIDFIQNLGQPVQVVSRIVIPHNVMPQFIDALRKNLDIYTNRYGAPAMPSAVAQQQQQQQRRLSVQEIYDELKIPDELLSGTYANGLMIGHTATEFRLDFLTNLFPHSAVSARIFMSAPQIPRTIDSLQATFQAFQQRLDEQRRANEED